MALFGGITAYGYIQEVGTDETQATGQTRTDFVDESDLPEDVQSFQTIAFNYHRKVTKYYPDSRVFVQEDGVVHEFNPSGDSGDDLKAEFHRVAKVFANMFAETDADVPAPTFTAVVGEVQAILTPAVLDSYRAGELKENAVVETVAITSLDRTASSENTDGGHDHGSHDHNG